MKEINGEIKGKNDIYCFKLKFKLKKEKGLNCIYCVYMWEKYVVVGKNWDIFGKNQFYI